MFPSHDQLFAGFCWQANGVHISIGHVVQHLTALQAESSAFASPHPNTNTVY